MNAVLVAVRGSEGMGTSASMALYISVKLFWPCHAKEGGNGELRLKERK